MAFARGSLLAFFWYRRSPRFAAPSRWSRVNVAAGALAALAVAATGCSPKIGDKCVLSTDCSVSGGRLCDLSQPGGYCTVLNCVNNSCPDDAVCVLFQSSVPGCAYDDYQSPSRTGRIFCMEHCKQDSDCRESEGYVCRNPIEPPWNATVLDNNQSRGVCIIAPGLLADAGANYGAAVCSPSGGDGALASEMDAEADAGASPDASSDAGAADGEADATVDGTADVGADGGVDATLDAPADVLSDAGAADAPDGG